MSERSELMQLAALVEAQEVAGYRMPDPVLTAWDCYLTTQAMVVPDAPELQHQLDAAVLLVDAIAAGHRADPVTVVKQIEKNQASARTVDDARRLLRQATEEAARRAVADLRAHAETVIVNCLRPAFMALLQEASRVAGALKGYSPEDVRALMTAPEAVRGAFEQAHRLADRYELLRQALRQVHAISGAVPEHDVNGVFADFEQPMALWPGWTTRERPRSIDAPKGRAERLLWLVGDGAVAKPWLPQVAEREHQWQEVFGEQVRRISTAADHARAGVGR